MKTDSISNQLRWVILLLAAAVILPTVCLLWFMNQAVKNERLVIRQKLTEMYRRRVNESVIDKLNETITQEFAIKDEFIAGMPKQMAWQELWQNIPLFHYNRFSGYLIFDEQKRLLWPVLNSNDEETDFLFDSEPLRTARQKELGQNNTHAALIEYQQIAHNRDNREIGRNATKAMLRSCIKREEWAEAIGLCQGLSIPNGTTESQAVETLRFVVLLVELCNRAGHWGLLGSHLHTNLVQSDSYVYHNEILNRKNIIPTETEIWARQKMLDIATEAKLDKSFSSEIEVAKSLVKISQLSLQTAESLPGDGFFTNWSPQTIRTIPSQQELFGIYYEIKNNILLCLITPKKIKTLLEETTANTIKDDIVQIQVMDPSGKSMLEDGPVVPQTDKILLSLPLGQYFPDWKVQLSFRNKDIFEEAIQKQVTIYIWAGILVIIMVIAFGSISIHAINNQIKMNRLKNDFIATVTHELKTPLASMRVLVDTLLEGHYEGKKTATEYLQMVANENKRLTHLIDSFLTFSRMERNKQVFDSQPIDPREIAKTAAEAVQTKFQGSSGILPESQTAIQQNNCRFTCTVEENLPAVNADKDAMITVLVNLLDNAYKYTNNDKHIELKVYAQNGFVCFTVTDNGIGISRRVQKKIFTRFYQVDSRLSRSVEGCGLGLSIVKFIVDAHRGTVEVESQPEQGSTFTVRLPKC